MSTELVSDFMKWKDLAVTLEPGDLIEFRRGNLPSSGRNVYQHWAVYMGVFEDVHKVIHYSNEDLSDDKYRKWGNYIEVLGDVEVQWELLEKVADGCPCRKNNSRDKKNARREQDEILNVAKDNVGKAGYSLATNNCEHFANFCRYGTEWSGQVKKAITVGVIVGAAAVAGGIAGGIAYSKMKKKKTDEKEESAPRT